MKEKIVANDRKYLKTLVDKEINQCGNECNLNHIDISKIKDLSGLFEGSEFNGDISKWDVSNVTNMSYLFLDSQFNDDISKWDVSNVTDMSNLFCHSKFNRDISNWDTSNVTNMKGLFYNSKFNSDVSNWRPLKAENTEAMFSRCSAPVPYWLADNNKEVVKNIESYDLFNKINSELTDKDINLKKMKI